MTDQPITPQMITDYLLGSLPVNQTERLDEMSVANDEFAANLKAVENDLVDAYVRRELTGTALQQFRLHYLASPLRREKVRFAQAFQHLSESPSSAFEVDSRQEMVSDVRAKAGWRKWFRRQPTLSLALQRGLALGAIALLLIGGWLALENNRLRHQLSAEQSAKTELMRHEQELQARLNDQRAASLQTEQELAQLRNEREQAGKETAKGSGLIATLVLNPQMRGSGQVPGVRIEPETKSLAAHLNLEPNDYTAYRVSLIDQANHQTRWTSPVLKATNGANKTLNVGIRTDLLKSQSYVLRVTGLLSDGSAEVMSDYPFRVLK